MRRTAALLIILAASSAGSAVAQEPSRLERLAGVCRTDGDVVLGRYAGRVLWLEDGQLSGMLTREVEGESEVEGFVPRSLTIAKQTPTSAEDGLVLQSRAALAGADGGGLLVTPIACTVRSVTAPARSDPGATARG